MHLTTLVSLLAAGAVAVPAPAPKVTGLSTKIPHPSGLPKAAGVANLARRQGEEPSSSSSAPASSSSGGLIPGLPGIGRRQAAEPTGAPAGQPSFREFTEEQDRKAAAEPEDPLDAYLDTFTADGDYDEADQDAKLQAYLDSLKHEPKKNETAPSGPSAKPASESTEEPKVAATNATSEEPAAAAAPKNESSDALKAEDLPTKNLFDFKKLMGMGKEDKEAKPSNATSEEPAAAPKNETNTDALKMDELPTHEITKGFDFKKLMGEDAPAKNESSAEPAAAKKNETEAATSKNETAPATESSSGPTDQLTGLLGGLPVGKRQDIPQLPDLPIAKRQAEDEKTATPVEDAKNITSPAANATSAQPSGTGNAGFYGINKHMEKLDKLDALPIGGLPIKREAFEEGDRFDTRFETPSQPEGVAQPSGMPAQEQGFGGFAAPSGFAPPAQPQGVAQPTAAPVVNAQPTGFSAPPPAQSFPAPSSSAPARGGDRSNARMSRTNKPVYKTDAPAKPQGKPAGGSPLDSFLVPLQRKQASPPAAGPPASSKPAQAAAAPTGGAPEEKPEESSPFAALFGKKDEKNATEPAGKPEGQKPESEEEEESSPFAALFGKKSEGPAEGKPEEAAPAKPEEAAKPESESESPLAGLMGKKPEAPTESKGEAPAPTASKPAESSSAPASPLAGLMGRAITEQHEEFSPEMVKPSPAEGGEKPAADSTPSVDEILADFA